MAAFRQWLILTRNGNQNRNQLFSHDSHRGRAFLCALTLGALIAAAALLAAAGCATPGPSGADRTPEKLAAQVERAMGGRRALRKIHFLQFEIIVQAQGREALRRTHLWDLKTGNYRLEGKRQGVPYVALFNVRTRQGQAFEGLRPAPAQNPAQLLGEAYAIYLHDTFWLLGALNLRQSGVQLEDAGMQTVAGRPAPALRVRFDPAADPTPGLIWTFLIDPVTHLPVAWSFIQTDQPGAAPSVYLWTEYRPLGKLTLPTRFEQQGAARTVVIDQLYTPSNVTPNVFSAVNEPAHEKVKPQRMKRQ